MDKIIIPFGEECYTCQSLDSKFSSNTLRKCAFPFDYVGHTYIEQIYDNISDLLNGNLSITNNDFSLQLFNDTYFLYHTKYLFKYWHDISSSTNNISDKEFSLFVEKYNRRYNRLLFHLKYATNITILSVNHFDNIYNKINKPQSILKLFTLLKLHNKNIKFISINFGEDTYNLDDLEFINLTVNYDLDFVTSKHQFTTLLNDFIKLKFE